MELFLSDGWILNATIFVGSIIMSLLLPWTRDLLSRALSYSLPVSIDLFFGRRRRCLSSQDTTEQD